MPIYEYRCSKCGQEFERLVSFAESAKVACPSCGLKAERLFSTFATAGGSTSSEGASCTPRGPFS